MGKRCRSWAPCGTVPKSWLIWFLNSLFAHAWPQAEGAPTARVSSANTACLMRPSYLSGCLAFLAFRREILTSFAAQVKPGLPPRLPLPVAPMARRIDQVIWRAFHDRGHDEAGEGSTRRGTGTVVQCDKVGGRTADRGAVLATADRAGQLVRASRAAPDGKPELHGRSLSRKDRLRPRPRA